MLIPMAAALAIWAATVGVGAQFLQFTKEKPRVEFSDILALVIATGITWALWLPNPLPFMCVTLVVYAIFTLWRCMTMRKAGKR